MKYNLITILGPTAVGKTRLGTLLADKFNGEIISADSRQVYRGMDIGTGKDLKDYEVDRKIIPFHLIDVCEPNNEYNLFFFYKMFFYAFHQIETKSKTPFLVGGTGLFIHSVLKDYSLNEAKFSQSRYDELNNFEYDELVKRLIELQPKQHNTTDLITKERVIKALMIVEEKEHHSIEYKKKINSLVVGVGLPREVVRQRITERLKERLKNGMIEEVERLILEGITYARLEQLGLEYKYVAKYLMNELSYELMFERLNTAIHQFAKRQMTWFRKMEREGIKINWLDGANYQQAEKLITEKYF
ncbi:MAG: tRNA dimethylallyltransferase [Ignavibacteria bacterium]|nr:MAG: tRNA dimethylallyltransferase [Ignavibacteria bacterium]KAF0157789.1 MAG: tRNA dimethylallyltransferase [Ignavibacteria bacterium]